MLLNKPSLIHICAYFPPHLGGLEVVVRELTAALASRGNTVTVLTSDLHAIGKKKIELENDVVIKRLWSFEFAHTAFIPSLFWQLVTAPKPTIFHLHLAQAFVPEMVWLASKLRNIPYVVHFHLDVEPSGRLGFLFVLWKKVVQSRIIKDASFVIALSPDQLHLIKREYGVPVDRIRFIRNGVSEAFFKIGEAKHQFQRPTRLLYVGRLSLQKRVERIVSALHLIKSDVTLSIVGNGEDLANLQNLVSRHNLTNVQFKGRLDGELLKDAYKNADIFVLPSDREGMPLVLLEAMASGIPVVGSDVMGIRELIQGVGVLVSNPSPETFADAIDQLVADPKRLEKLSLASLEKASEYDWKGPVSQLEQVYDEVK